MDVSIHVGYGDDLSLDVSLEDCTVGDAAQLLGAVCNEMLRVNLALTMQEADAATT